MTASLPLRERLSLCPLTTPDMSTEDDIALCAAVGLRRLSLSMHKLAAGGEGAPDSICDRIRSAGLSVDLVYPAAGLELRDPDSWPATRARLLEALEVAAMTEARSILLPSGAARGLLWEDAVEALGEAVAPVVADAADLGVRLLLEPVRPQFAYASFIHSLRDGVGLARSLGTGLILDATHCWWEPGLADVVTDAVDLVGTVHLADLALDGPVTVRVVPGDGHLPLAELLAMLDAAGYAGPFELELIGPAIVEEGPLAAVARAINFLCEL